MPKIKEILCMHHSHLDIGYTHPQPLLLELQQDYIDQAIDLCLKTSEYPEESRFRWTCEAAYPLTLWLKTASAQRLEQFRELARSGRISVAALPMHTTPGCNIRQMVEMVRGLDILRDRLGIPIRCAINHDVNGQPWPLSQILLDSGVDFYLTGINIHFGGIPFPRPAAFRWQTPDGRELLTFLGEHYSLFSQFCHTSEADTARMDEGIREYVNRLEHNGYRQNFAFLTATNPPLFDNNCPDVDLADLIRRYNAEGHEQTVRFVTPEMLRARVLENGLESIPVHRGDWTDFWNFGCASTARETRVNRRAKTLLKDAELIETRCGSPSARYDSAKRESWFSTLLYDEHSWGATQSVTDPKNEEVHAQRLYKSAMAYRAADLAAYVLGSQAERLAGNPPQSGQAEGLLVVNTSCAERKAELRVPEEYTAPGRRLAALSVKQQLPYPATQGGTVYYGTVDLEPFSYKKIPFSALEKRREQLERREPPYTVGENEIVTPFYRVRFQPATGRILQITDLRLDWPMLDETSDWTAFEFVRETVDGRLQPKTRSTLFPRDIELGNRSVSVWNHGWKAKREGAEEILKWKLLREPESVSFVWKSRAAGCRSLEQKITFSATDARIRFHAVLEKEPVTEPESVYFALPLHLEESWNCWYDTAGTFVQLDDDQLGNSCRGWVTVDKTVSLCDAHRGVLLACPDAPMVQVGGFHFGREKHRIERGPDPLLLAWPLNNYWDTNFEASQSGKMEFRYELVPFRSFDPASAVQAGETAAGGIVLDAVVRCSREESGRLLEGEGAGVVPVFVLPSEKEGCILLGVQNLTGRNASYTFRIPGTEVRAARIVSPQGKFQCGLTVQNGTVEVPLKPRELLLVEADGAHGAGETAAASEKRI